MDYIVRKRFKKRGIDGDFNLPAGTVCSTVNNIITAPDGRSICMEHSENGYEFFCPNTDEGKNRWFMLERLYQYYTHGKGNATVDFLPNKWGNPDNTYWKHILRTMPTPSLTAFYMERLGIPSFEEEITCIKLPTTAIIES